MAHLKYMSVTRASMYLQCPQKYDLCYNQGFKEPKKPALMQGIVYHETVAADLKHLKKNGCLMEEDELYEVYSQSFDEEAKKVEDWQDLVPGRVKDNGFVMARLYHRKEAGSIYPLEVEEKKEAIIGGFTFVFICDVVARHGKNDKRIIDHKLKKKPFSNVDIRKNLQATGYSMATNIPRVEFHQAIKSRIPDIIITPTLRGPNDYAMFEHIISGIGRGIESGIFYPNPTDKWCSEKWCHCYDICHGRSTKMAVDIEVTDLCNDMAASLPAEPLPGQIELPVIGGIKF